MSGVAAASPEAHAAYVPPGGGVAVTVGTATYHFLNIPLKFSTGEFLGIAFLLFVTARYWGKFVNKVAL